MLRSLFALILISATFSTQAADKVEIQTNLGNIIVELNSKAAPETVENFLRYANDNFYDNTVFHRVIANFMVQGGGYTADGKKKTTHKPIKNEAQNGLKNLRGTLAMARTSDPHSATAQFFINLVDNKHLNHRGTFPGGWGYSVFGQVTEGMDVVNKIAALRTGKHRKPGFRDAPNDTVTIKKIILINDKK